MNGLKSLPFDLGEAFEGKGDPCPWWHEIEALTAKEGPSESCKQPGPPFCGGSRAVCGAHCSFPALLTASWPSFT